MKLETGNWKPDLHAVLGAGRVFGAPEFQVSSFTFGVPRWMCLFVVTCCLAQAAFANPPPTQPSVTREEAQFLELVNETAATNLAGAVTLFDGRKMERASAALDFALGNLHLKSGQYDQAEAAYTGALNKLPSFRRAVANLGRVYLLLGDSERATARFVELVNSGPVDGDILILMGHALLLGNRPVSAENAYRQAMLRNPDSEDALLGLAKSLLLQERHAEAVHVLEEMIEQDVARSELWSLRANALLAMDDMDAARVAFETARRLQLADGEMLATLGDMYLNAQQPRVALERYHEAFTVTDPSIDRLLRATGGLLTLGRLDEAGELLGTAHRLREEDPARFDSEDEYALLRIEARLAEARGETAEAAADYEEMLRRNPLDGETLVLLGNLQHRGGDLEAAVMSYERVARIQGYEVQGLVRQAEVEVERERYARAVELLEAAQTIDEQPHVARYLDQLRRLAARQ